ncbi:hypothetical protein NL676_008106 [Syzygium grande]|nr:hypothetical protein NL676_008106 [Syzygium grande]
MLGSQPNVQPPPRAGGRPSGPIKGGVDEERRPEDGERGAAREKSEERDVVMPRRNVVRLPSTRTGVPEPVPPSLRPHPFHGALYLVSGFCKLSPKDLGLATRRWPTTGRLVS